MRLIVLTVVALIVGAADARAETVCVKYGSCIRLDKFDCQPMGRSSFIWRTCYAAAERYMIIWLGRDNTAYHYCAIPPDVVAALRNAPSPGSYYNSNVIVRSNSGRYDCRLHPAPDFR